MAEPPALLIIGGRGWKSGSLVERLTHSPLLEGNVLEISGLSTISMRNLVAGATALLMPSLAEGYGLPIVEALSIGTPVLASDIPVFREASQGRGTYLPLGMPQAWSEAIVRLTVEKEAVEECRRRASLFRTQQWDDYINEVLERIASARKAQR